MIPVMISPSLTWESDFLGLGKNAQMTHKDKGSGDVMQKVVRGQILASFNRRQLVHYDWNARVV